MQRRSDKGGSSEDPPTPREIEEYETDLISFSDRELDLLGDIRDLSVLYAGGTSLLWLEGLSQRIGPNGSLTALDADADRIEESGRRLEEADLPAPVRLVAGSVFRPPFERGAFDLLYSAGLLHELDLREGSAREALAALARTVRPGGRLATSDFVDTEPAVQLEDEELERQLAWEVRCARLYGVGPPERLIGLHETVLEDVRWRVSAPRRIRGLDKLFLAEDEPEALRDLPAGARRRLRQRRDRLRRRVEREGYTRPATLYIEGRVPAS